jgi:hypothetical protein
MVEKPFKSNGSIIIITGGSQRNSYFFGGAFGYAFGYAFDYAFGTMG